MGYDEPDYYGKFGPPPTTGATSTTIVLYSSTANPYGNVSDGTFPRWRRRRPPMPAVRLTPAKCPFPAPLVLCVAPLPTPEPREAFRSRPRSSRLHGGPRERRALRARVERKDAA